MDDKDLDKLTEKELGILFPITITPYNDLWPELFKEEKENLLDILQDRAPRIEHFGSTAVPGLAAKPTIDILVAVDENNRLSEEIIDLMKSQGYEYILRKDAHPPYMNFVKGYTPRGYEGQCYHIHMAPEDHKGLWNRLYFRDYLRDHPQVAKEYENLKLQLAKDFKNLREHYTEGKREFVQRITGLAIMNS